MKTTPLLAFLAITAAAAAQQPGHYVHSMTFTDTDAAFVLQAISKQTGEQILYNNKNKISITLSLNYNTAEEAIKAVSSAASLVARRVNGMYLIAPRESMKDAIAPYAHTVSLNALPGQAEQMATKLQESFPFATVHAIGDKISFTGTAEDIQDASAQLQEMIRATTDLKPQVIDLFFMHQVNAEDVLPLIKSLFPGLEVASTTSTKTGGPGVATTPGSPTGAPGVGGAGGDTFISRIGSQNYGTISLRGPEALVKAARATLEKLDSPLRADGPNKIVFDVYQLKYANGPSLSNFLRRAAPEVEVFVGPEEYSPTRALFNPLSSQISSGSASGSSGLGGTSGGSSGSTSSGSGSGTGASQTVTPGAHVPVVGDRAKSIVLKGRQTDIDSAKKLIAELDLKPRQVVIEVKVIETSPTDSQQLGIGYTFSPVNFYDVAPGTLLTNATGAVGLTAGNTQSLAPTQVSRTPLNFQATLNAMVTKQTAKLLATPSLAVIDNDQGSIFIGNTVSVELSTTGALGAVSQSIVEFPVGIILLISPSITPDGNVILHVNPVISTISSINADGIPQTAAREAETTMIVKDGQTTVLGGLIQDQDTKTVSAVPFLSSLPIIGELFKNRTSSRTREDIIVSITPHIVKDPPEGTK